MTRKRGLSSYSFASRKRPRSFKHGLPDAADYAHDDYSEDAYPMDQPVYISPPIDPDTKKKGEDGTGDDGTADGGGDGSGEADQSGNTSTTTSNTKKDVMAGTGFEKSSGWRIATDIAAYSNPFTGTVAFVAELTEAIVDDDPAAIAVSVISWGLSWLGFGGLFARSAVATVATKAATSIAARVVGREAAVVGVEAVANTLAKGSAAVGRAVTTVEQLAAKPFVMAYELAAPSVKSGFNSALRALEPVATALKPISQPLGKALKPISQPLKNAYQKVAGKVFGGGLGRTSARLQSRLEAWQARNFPDVYSRMYPKNTGSRLLQKYEGNLYSTLEQTADDAVEFAERNVDETFVNPHWEDDVQQLKSEADVLRTKGVALSDELSFIKKSIDEDVAKLQEALSKPGSTTKYSVRRGGNITKMDFVGEIDKLFQGKISENKNTLKFLETIGVDLQDIRYAELQNKQSVIRKAMYKKYDEMVKEAARMEAAAKSTAEAAAESTGGYVMLSNEPLTVFGHLVDIARDISATRGLGSDSRPISIWVAKFIVEKIAHHFEDLRQHQMEQQHSAMNKQLGDDYFTNT